MNRNIFESISKFHSKNIHLPINKKELEDALKKMIHSFFPVCDEEENETPQSELIQVYDVLMKNLAKLTDTQKATQIIEQFFEKLPEIQDKLYQDAESFWKNDPAAESIEEVIITYPGFFALVVHRIAHELYVLKAPIIPRLFSEYAHSKVGVDIHPGASIGKSFFLDHGTGTVIGETCLIGNNVKIYQGVTLGALYVTKNLSKVKRHPTVEDNVVIYAGATILGGDTVVGHDSTIGGNVWITHSIIPYSLVYYTSEMKIKTVKDFKEPIDYVI